MTPTDTTFDPVPLSEPVIGSNEREWVNQCLDSGFVSTAGGLISEFEQRFAERVGAAHAVATASGTAALHVAMRLAGVQPGDTVAVQDLTFVASVNPAIQLGADPLLVDVDPESWTLDVGLLERFFEEQPERAAKIKAVVPVHLYGCAVDMNRLLALSARFGFKIVEDATEALGTRLAGRQVGTLGDLGCFSFNGNKMMTTGSGGMIVTQSRELAEQARNLVAQAREPGRAYLHGTDGYNYRMTNLNAALGLAQLDRLDEMISAKRRIAGMYREALDGIEGVTFMPESREVENCCWLSSVRVEPAERAGALLKELERHGIMARPFFLPLHSQPYLREAAVYAGDVSNSDALAACGINLPSSASLSEAQQHRVISLLRSLLL